MTGKHVSSLIARLCVRLWLGYFECRKLKIVDVLAPKLKLWSYTLMHARAEQCPVMGPSQRYEYHVLFLNIIA